MSASMLDSDNALLIQARNGKRLTPIWLVILMAIAIPIVSQIGVVPIFMFNLMRRAPDLASLAENDVEGLIALGFPQTALQQTLFLLSAFAGIYLLVWLWVRFVEGRPLTSVGLTKNGAYSKLGRGFGVGIFMFALTIILGGLIGVYSLEVNPVLNWQTIIGVIVVLLGWLVQGSAEELLFRGWVLPVVAARYRVWLGIVISALLFALAHILNPGIGPTAILNLLLFGLFTALYTLREENLWGVFGIHATWNWVQGSIFGLEVSGLVSPGGSLFVARATGPAILTGGAFGPEGGLLVTLVLGLSIGGLFWLNRRNRSES